MASRLRFVLAQLGWQPGAKVGLSRLLDASDLVANEPISASGFGLWRRLDQRAWRTGAVASPRPWQVAARAAGSLTVWRSLVCRPRGPWLWVQWIPLVDATDAAQALVAAQDPTMGLRNLRADVETLARRDLQSPPVVVGADLVSATEEDTTDPGTVLTLRCTAGRHLVVLCAAGAGWDWPALVSLAELQLPRLPTA